MEPSSDSVTKTESKRPFLKNVVSGSQIILIALSNTLNKVKILSESHLIYSWELSYVKNCDIILKDGNCMSWRTLEVL